MISFRNAARCMDWGSFLEKDLLYTFSVSLSAKLSIVDIVYLFACIRQSIPHRTVSCHIANYKKGGLEALIINKQPGAQKKLSDDQKAELGMILDGWTGAS